MSKPLWANVEPQIQHTPVSCGQTSAAMAIKCLTGKNMSDLGFGDKYDFGLIYGLNKECEPKYHWTDAGNFSRSMWADLEHRMRNGFPVIIGLNGEFSISGHGHIVLLFKIEGDKVTYADPADGTIKATKKSNIEKCKDHPDGKFVFVCSKKA